MDRLPISIPSEQLTRFCQQNSIKRLALFGSVLRRDFRPESDVDVLVEFEAGAQVGLMRLSDLEMQLTSILGHKVDLNTAGFLSRHFVNEVLSEAVPIYDAA